MTYVLPDSLTVLKTVAALVVNFVVINFFFVVV